MSDATPNEHTPQDDAERIRLKRLAKLQTSASGFAAPSGSSTPAIGTSRPSSPKPPLPKVISKPSPATKKILEPTPTPLEPPIRKKAPLHLDLDIWEDEMITGVLKVTLDKSVAEQSSYDIVWLKPLADEMKSEAVVQSLRLNIDLIDRLLIARLEIDPKAMTDDLDFLPVLASLPPQQTIFEYLVGAWKRLNMFRTSLIKKGYTPAETQTALTRLDKLRDLVISYSGLTLQEPEMFPQPSGRLLGPPELVTPLLSLSTLSTPLYSSSTASANTLSPTDVELFLQDLARRFEPDNEIDEVLGDVVRQLLFHESLFRPEGLGGAVATWRGVVGGLEALVSVKSIAVMITRMPEWIPANATAANFEKLSLMGPLCRLSVFAREWPAIAQSYFSEPEKRSPQDLESSYASLRGTLKSLQGTLFHIFNTLVRAAPKSREAVLQYFNKIVSLNVKRAGLQVDPDTVASDSFMVNIQSVLYRFAEPFMDASYTKIDRIDPLYFAHSDRIDVTEETRIKATAQEASQWAEENRLSGGPAPNFISDIFYLAVATSHYGYQKTISSYIELDKHMEDIERHLSFLNGDGSWMGTPLQARIQASINNINNEKAKVQSAQYAYEAQLKDPELVFRSIGFTIFLSVWLIRQADPKKTHPNPLAELPLSKDVPMSFRVLPEYIVEDIVDYFHFATRHAPDKFELAGKTELLTFILTFLSSTWYIKNPFLKSKINDVLFLSIWGYGRESTGILGGLLNTHPLALKHLMSMLMHFYIEVEQTGASSQFYDKFNARRNISYVLKVVWNNPTHREALNREAENVDKFIRFINLMINDVTYLMDESLSELTQIHDIQTEMDNKEEWNSKPLEYRREREGTLRQLERHASSYTTLGRSTVELLKLFTAETKKPFMMPEIVDKLAAMLDYNLEALVGPRMQNLKVRQPEKLRFDPKALLSDVLQIFLNLSDQPEFMKAIAGDGRSYSKGLFEQAERIMFRRSLKSGTDLEKWRLLITKVEEAKETLEAEDDLGDIPDEFLDPLMFSIMRDPVILPTSRTTIDRSTIKSHLLSDTTDPFNRMPLAIEDVVSNTELKSRIDAFLIERKQRNKAAGSGLEDSMNVTH
ncbi:ubiquitin elongating factor core-domain-containing protein [Lentinula lateritia]|uniref:Ubiquitin elongating factor core-domain-containing protein n=1 Tax=Lentinula lateritia TaxID=40482 RepID=A0ABQ8V1U5_9AGAR|nr:ubiquitin elongating factor core-domain-containing protein [Lentinula lateritia]